ncbi:hypothetical protein KAV79_07455 [Candidatus Aerophobetes bacterium]|nr:hypothetical protein [Candidatus Aerophobetes bacterium]
MSKRVRCLLEEVSQNDDDSVGVFLNFDGIEDPGKVIETIKIRKKIGEQVTIWDVILAVVFINNANREK